MAVGYIVSFFFGAVFLAIVEILLLWYLFGRSGHRRKHDHTQILPSLSVDADPSGPLKISLEGELWVAAVSPLQIDTVNKSNSMRPPRDKKQRKEIEQKTEISVSLKHAKLQDRVLILTGTDGSTSSIQLDGCSVLAVSSTSSATRKWAKKFPIKLEHSTRALLGTTICLLYFKTGWEKETWCEALLAAARTDYGPDDWYLKVKHEFKDYINQLKDNYPEVFRTGSVGEKNLKESIRSTKKSLSWKRLLKKKKSEGGVKTRAVTVQTEEQDLINTGSSEFENLKEESDTEGSSDVKKILTVDYGTGGVSLHTPKLDGCATALNLMLSRLFFDLSHNSDFTNSVHTRIQTLLSRIPTPSYISPITCTRFDIGKSCPLVLAMRGLPIKDDVFGIEADIEYTGGAVLTLETRLDMRESRVGDQKNEASSAGASATADIINKSLETVEDDLEIAAADAPADQSTSGSRRKRWQQWKALLSSVADQVSQVPLTLSMRVVSLKGTLQLRVKAAPSDRIWYSFSSMPSLELFPEPSVGDRKITTAPLLAYIAERIQILVYQTMVYPNSEDIHVPWMVADTGNWVQQTAAPFPQVLAEPKYPGKTKESNYRSEGSEAESVHALDASGAEISVVSELERPLLEKQKTEMEDTTLDETGENNSVASDNQGSEGETRGSIGEESRRRKGITRREKMLSLGKKFEEKTRILAEKVRERFEKD